CLSCGKSFSLLQKVGSTEKDTTCPHCGSREVKKLLSAFSCSIGFGSSGGGGFSAPT
ncbi:MAG: zinc ribbon domain-containing protein, partial [Nitrospirae bacterium]